MKPYNQDFYEALPEYAQLSAKEVVPLVIELIDPKSVIDVGCGLGTWLAVFQEHGIEDFLGVDGYYIDRKMLQIPEEKFYQHDLEKPFQIDKQFDLVMSLEVAEHLPREYAETFVDSLVKLGAVILFSAAIPLQGGINHLNEQWPDYWTKYFNKKGYMVVDCIRKKIWQNEKVNFWYAQNILMFVRQDYLESHHLLKREFEQTITPQLSVVHPRMYLESHNLKTKTIKQSLGMMRGLTINILERIANRIQNRKFY
jgi:SAM-dependent methyltransferase